METARDGVSTVGRPVVGLLLIRNQICLPSDRFVYTEFVCVPGCWMVCRVLATSVFFISTFTLNTVQGVEQGPVERAHRILAQ